jgi:hypothetical protein
MMKNSTRLFAIATIALTVLLIFNGSLFAQKSGETKKVPGYKTIPSSSFLTINAEYLGGYRPDQFFNPQVPAFGLKLGTMRNVGWFVSAMTNFNFKGTFVTCDPEEIIPEATSSSYFEALAGITLRYWRPMSLHIGLGYMYRSFNNETIYGQWAHTPNSISQGPAATAGLMFHFGGFVISAEVVGGYNLHGIKLSDYPVDKTRITFGAKAGLGICIPYKYRDEYESRMVQPATAAPQPVYYEPTPAPQQPAAQTVVEHVVVTDTAPAPKCAAVPASQPAKTLTVVTLPISQLSPGWIVVSGEVAEEGEEPVIERGICWGTTPYPSITGSHTADGSGAGYFTTVVSDLRPDTIYYFRAYAGTKSGLRYGNTVSVTLPKLPQQPVTQPMPQQQPMPQAAPQPQPMQQPAPQQLPMQQPMQQPAPPMPQAPAPQPQPQAPSAPQAPETQPASTQQVAPQQTAPQPPVVQPPMMPAPPQAPAPQVDSVPTMPTDSIPAGTVTE